MVALARTLGLILVLALSACASDLRRTSNSAYTVQGGDTLYFISWKYQLDYHQLAKWNNLKAPYTIYTGQKLWLHAPIVEKITQKADNSSKNPQNINKNRKNPAKYHQKTLTQHRVKPGETVYSIAKSYNISVAELARINSLDRNYTIYPQQLLKLQAPSRPKPTAKPAPAIKPAPIPAPVVVATSASTPDFMLPAKGLVHVYKQPGGIDISGNHQQAVYASAAGKVVYVGSGIPLKGKLIIIKHDQQYMSAYAHCAEFLVKVDQYVKRGSTIASMGKLPTRKYGIQFELRKQGKVVNIKNYIKLPMR